MKKTPQEFKRKEVKELFSKVLGESKISFAPLAINISESLENDFTVVNILFSEKLSQSTNTQAINEIRAKGFVDGLFIGLYEKYIETYPSLKKIKLLDLMVNPIMKASTTRGSDAQTSVVLRVKVKDFGISEFQHQSRSMIYSSFISTLQAFQFYINCEICFHKIKLALEDAKTRNRGDIIQSCMLDLSKLTGVNTYAKEKN
jgi:translation initiation factor 2 beta subunit (eIF-2beta)/eIF-5